MPEQEEKPNILLIMTDQQRYDSLGCYGFEAAHTPNLDQVAEEGVIFDNNYVTNPICTPNRSSMLTGKPLPGHGLYQLYDNLPEDEVLFTRRLQEIGYETALFGKLHIASRLKEEKERHPNDGFDIYEWCLEPSISLDSPLNGYAKWLKDKDPDFYRELKEKGRNLHHIPQEFHGTHWAAERSVDYIQNWDGEKPFFLKMSVFDPHNPYDDYPLEMEEVIDQEKIPDPLTAEGEMDNPPEPIRREHEHSYLGSFKDFTLEEIREMRIGYHASLAFLDQEVGKVLNALQEAGIAENTLVIFTSDHGDMLGDHQLMVKGCFFYDPCTKVPLIMHWPNKINEGMRIPSLVQSTDIAATVLSAAGFSSEELKTIMPESHDLLPLIQGEQDKIREYAVCIYRNSGIDDRGDYFDPPMHATMIRDQRYKLNIYHSLNSSEDIEGELYDMAEDPNELTNLWNDSGYDSIKKELMEKLIDWNVRQELRLGSRGGDYFPDASKKLVNKIRCQ